MGTEQSPGTVVCTVTGYTRRHGVGEFAMGTPLRDIIDEIGGGAPVARRAADKRHAVAQDDLIGLPVAGLRLRHSRGQALVERLTIGCGGDRGTIPHVLCSLVSP